MGEMSDHIERFGGDNFNKEINRMSGYINSVETVTIDRVTQYGGKVNGKSYNLGKKYTGPAFEEGATYEVRISTSPNGAKYVNEARKVTGATQATVKAGPLNEVSLSRSVGNGVAVAIEQNPPRVNGSSLSPSEKDIRILVQGTLQAVASSPYLVSAQSDADFETRVEGLTNRFVEFIRNFK